MAERKAVIKAADMSEDMQQDAVDCASHAMERYNIEKVCCGAKRSNAELCSTLLAIYDTSSYEEHGCSSYSV